MHNSSEMKASFEAGVTSMQSFPVRSKKKKNQCDSHENRCWQNSMKAKL